MASAVLEASGIFLSPYLGALFHALLHVGHPSCPERAIFGSPAIVDALNRHRIEVEPAAAPFLFADQQVGGLQPRQMLHGGNAAKGKVRGDTLHRHPWTCLDQVHHLPPGRMGDGLKDKVLGGLGFGAHW